MIKKSLYPKTERITDDNSKFVITEKLDGSNIGFFKLDGNLLIATRNNIIPLTDIEDYKHLLYTGMYGWLVENGQHLLDNLIEGSGFFGEWIGMGKLKYDFDKRVYMFAKANINLDFEIRNLYYNLDLLKYPFVNQVIPDYLDIVPKVYEINVCPSVAVLNILYINYITKVGRNVEGFVINNNNSITKYVRMKNGKIEEHQTQIKTKGDV